MTVKRKARGPAKLPAQQLAILAACRFAEPIASTSVFPYLPEMIESFGIEKAKVARWAGATSAVFSLAQCATAIFWGRLSDSLGRKPVILTGLTITMFTSIFWGLSINLPWAVAARALSGGGNGNVGIIRTMVAEMVQHDKALQPRAFSIMPLVWSIGSIFGPAFGGFFAKPAANLPALFGNNAFLIRFPFALPNLIAACFFMIGIIIGFLFLKETHEVKKYRPDYGLFLGKKLVRCFKRESRQGYRRLSEWDEEPDSAVMRPTSSLSTSSKGFDPEFQGSDHKSAPPAVTVREVFTRQSSINLISYTFLALHSVAFDQVLPIFLHHPKQTPDSTNTRLPFKFSGGFGLDSGRIGTLFTMYGVCGGFVQFVIFPPVARRYGVLNCLRVCTLVFPLVFLVTPYTALIQDSVLQQAAIFSIMVVKSFAGIFAFPCCTIMLTNSALSLRVLGTLNGVATSVSAIGRATGPALIGSFFTLGIERGYMIMPWWILAAIATIGIIPVLMLVEMEGFGGSDDRDDDEEDDADASSVAEDGSIVYGDEGLLPNEAEEAIDVVEGPPLADLHSTSLRVPSAVERRMSSPIGIRDVGPGGGRRLSNGLGQSNFGQGTGGTTFH
ncbi:MAG: hypothetical protein M1818_003613 [Claussenomyces sp. TS43310]|nr:MAG: hypothetical protein M1818_003613 [Claussenomyces sp. TS43310]